MKRVLTISIAAQIIILLGCKNNSKQPEGGTAEIRLETLVRAEPPHDTVIIIQEMTPEPPKFSIAMTQVNTSEYKPAQSVNAALNRSERPIDLGLNPLAPAPINQIEGGYAFKEGGYADIDYYPADSDIGNYSDYPTYYYTNNYYLTDYPIYYVHDHYYFVDNYWPPYICPPPYKPPYKPPYRPPHKPVVPRPPHKPNPPKPIENHRDSRRPVLPEPARPQFADLTRTSERSPIINLPAKGDLDNRNMITQRERREADIRRQKETEEIRRREAQEQASRERREAEHRQQQEVQERADRERREAESRCQQETRERENRERQVAEARRQQQEAQERVDRERKEAESRRQQQEAESRRQQQEAQERADRERREADSRRQQQEAQERANRERQEAESRRQQQESVERADRERREADSRRQQQEAQERASRERQETARRQR